ncbi:hypothetical protein KDX14_28700 [Burkholderia cenocepacia]|uniref:hypothetical protein n=1 Tax=Burkholderia cenocepacia TaxID=95486 RepID=UPI001B94C1F3|nr:hypothetical protein [Burkholderia cenocepacia]MBR8073512.1 hypothetical protein [Burkholderia cenocepacia]
MTAYIETNAEVIEKALYCLKHGETESVENWLGLLSERLGSQPAAAPCKRCGATTAQACNDKGCFYLESGDGEPTAPAPADERAAWRIDVELAISAWGQAMKHYDRNILELAEKVKALLDRAPSASQSVDEQAAYARGYYDGCSCGPSTEISQQVQHDVQVSGGSIGSGDSACGSSSRDIWLTTKPADERAVFEFLRELVSDDYWSESKANRAREILDRASSANETGTEGAKTEAEIRKTMTPEQIQLERKLTCEAIDGAMAFGYQNTNPPPSADHWLAPYWHVGRKQAELESRAPAQAAEPVAWIQHRDGVVWLDTLGSCERLEDFPHGTKFYTAPQPPAQADAREGLTVIQSQAIEIAIQYMKQNAYSERCEHIQGLRALLADDPGQPEPRASAGVIAAARAVIEADRAQTLTTEHVNALDNAIKIQHGELTLPEPRAEVTSVQWWLAELDQHGNPKLSDGAHSERAGADKAMYLIKNLGLDNKGKRWAVARVELSEPRPSADGVNHDAVSACRAMVDAARAGGA